MKRLKSTLATILLTAAAAAAIGLGTVMAVAALVIGLVVAAAARLAMAAGRDEPIKTADIAEAQVTAVS